MNRLRSIVILLVLLGGVALILFATSQFAVQNLPSPSVVTASVRLTATPGQPTTPIALFGPIDVAIIPALQGTPGSRPFAVLPSVQPVGVYLTAQPTNTPTPTHTPPPSFTPTASYTPSSTSTRVPTLPPTRTPSLTPTATVTVIPSPLPTPSPFPTDQQVQDYGIIQLQGLQMTPNPALVGNNCAPRGLPVDGVLTQRFHFYHSGIDLGVPIGTPVLATHSGQVIFAGWSYIGYGWLVIIQNEQYITYYAHNSAFNVMPMQYVHVGDVIAFSGSTGNSSGPHVHYETRINDVPVDPLTFDLRQLPTC